MVRRTRCARHHPRELDLVPERQAKCGRGLCSSPDHDHGEKPRNTFVVISFTLNPSETKPSSTFYLGIDNLVTTCKLSDHLVPAACQCLAMGARGGPQGGVARKFASKPVGAPAAEPCAPAAERLEAARPSTSAIQLAGALCRTNMAVGAGHAAVAQARVLVHVTACLGAL